MPCTHSCSVFLKAMTRGDEHRSKHRQDVSASSSGLSTKPKKLVKRPRPCSYQEESSPEVPPPRGGTPDETECLMTHSPEIHTNWEIMNYSKEDPMNVMHLCNKPYYNSSKERGTDERFWTFFHQDWYFKLVTCMVSLICSSLGTTGIKKSSLSSTQLSSMTRKRGYLCGWLMAKGSM
jgi:hypothetical protein